MAAYFHLRNDGGGGDGVGSGGSGGTFFGASASIAFAHTPVLSSISKGGSDERVVCGYRLGRTLGVGAQGRVKLATRIADGLEVALKVIQRKATHPIKATYVSR